MRFSITLFVSIEETLEVLFSENSEGYITFHRGCGWDDSVKTEECSIAKVRTKVEIKNCYKTCNTPLCNHLSMEETFPSFSVNCLHCSSFNQPWCVDDARNTDHLKEPGTTKKCWNAECSSTRYGKFTLNQRL